MKKKFLFFMIVCVGIFSFNVVNASSEDETCGKNVTYSIYSGTLIISGEGRMNDYDGKRVPWYLQRTSIKKVVIENGVTNVGKAAFEDLVNLYNVELADSVIEIGDYAFRGSRVKNITFGKQVRDIGKFVFANCVNLTEINLYNIPKNVGNNIFYNTNAVIRIHLSSLNEYLKSLDTSLKYNARDMIMPYVDKIYIGDNLLTDKEVWTGYTELPNNAFKGYLGLTEIEIPDTITSIGKNAFKGCKNMTGVLIPKSVVSIGDDAFSGVANLTNVMYNGDESSWNNINIGTNNESLNIREYFAYVTLKNDEYEETKKCILGKRVNEYFDLEELEKENRKEINLYSDSECTQNYDLESPILDDLIVYVKLGNQIDKYYDLSNAEVVGFSESVVPTNDNTQALEIYMYDKKLEENTDYVIWRYNTLLKGNAKMLIIGINEYVGYLEKSYDIVGDITTVKLGDDIIVQSSDKVQVIIPDGINFEKMVYEIDGNIVSTSKTDVLKDKVYVYDEGLHSIRYSYYTEERKGPNLIVKEHSTETTNIKSVNTETSKVEIEKILEGGRDTYYIKANVLPVYANNAELTWSSSDTSIATVDDFGVVKVRKAGKAVITAVTDNGKSLSVDMDIEPLKITKTIVSAVKKNDDLSYTIVLTDKYGILRENQDYTIKYTVDNNILKIEITGIGLYYGRMTRNYNISDMTESIIYGDIDDDGEVTMNDAIYLFNAAMFPDQYPIPSGQKTDYNDDGVFDMNDAIYLFNHAMFPDAFPI